jgi:hypothetical protein
MNATNTVRQSAVAAFALGVVLFTLTGLDSTLKPSTNFAATATTQTTAQA